MSGGPRVGWVVDAQVDFMDPGGRLYVRDLGNASDPGAARIVPLLAAAVAWMREHCDALVFTGDWHALEDEEIDAESPDPTRGTYPPHCMGRSPDAAERSGAEIIPEIRPQDPLVLDLDASDQMAQTVASDAIRTGRPVFVRKRRFDVFTGNPGTEAFVRALVAELGSDPEFVVVGVARDVCVTQAVDGLQARGHAVTALRDATWGLGLEDERATLERWSRDGHVTTLAALSSGSGVTEGSP